MSDQVNQSLRVNKCGKDKTNIFFQLDWFIPCVSSHEEEAQCFYQISCCHEMICLFTNGLSYFLSLSTKVGILGIVERTVLNRKMARFLNLMF